MVQTLGKDGQKVLKSFEEVESAKTSPWGLTYAVAYIVSQSCLGLTCQKVRVCRWWITRGGNNTMCMTDQQGRAS